MRCCCVANAGQINLETAAGEERAFDAGAVFDQPSATDGSASYNDDASSMWHAALRTDTADRQGCVKCRRPRQLAEGAVRS